MTPRSFFALLSLLCACAAPKHDTAASPDAEAPTVSAVGQTAPALRLQSRSGAAVDLADLRGKVVIVDFWASWCEPCREELPVLEKLYTAHRDLGLEILAVNIDTDRADADALLRGLPVSFPVLYDPEQQVVARWQPPKMPTSYIVDRDGTITVVQAGFEPDEVDALEAKLRALLE